MLVSLARLRELEMTMIACWAAELLRWALRPGYICEPADIFTPAQLDLWFL